MTETPKSMTPRSSGRVVRSAMFALIGFALAVTLIIGMVGATYLLMPLSKDPHAPVVIVVIHRGMSDRRIGQLLEQRHVIRHAAAFPIAARIEGVNGKMVAGTYELTASMTPRAIAWKIALGRTAEDFVTIPEGFTVRQIAKRLAARQMVDEHAFLVLATTKGNTFRVGSVAAPKDLEGYLFPDTYRIPAGTDARGIIQMMLDEFDRRVLTLDGGFLAKHPDRLADTVKLASLVEREAQVDEDRPKIAAALENRLRVGMKLECDASIEYALPVYKKRLFYKDLKIDSPYNTYLHAGLPPTAIANPGVPSIVAALHPAQVSYLYYVARPDGTHIFSDTIDEHNRAVAMIRAMRPRT